MATNNRDSSGRDPKNPQESPKFNQGPKNGSSSQKNGSNFKGSSDDKGQETKQEAREGKKVDELYDYATSNKEQMITYILLAVGLITLFFNNMMGGLIIGVVAGYHFAPEIVYYIRNLNQIIEGQNHIRYVVLTALLLGLLIAAPGIFIGAAIIAAFKQVLFNKDDPNHRP